ESHHNHKHCIKDAMASARQFCESRGVRLTALRDQVLELIWQTHKPLGAYTSMYMLASASSRRVSPPTVHRALDFLLEQGLVYRITGLDAFIGCPCPGTTHHSVSRIWRICDAAVGLDNQKLNQDSQSSAKAAGFVMETHSLEVMGVCPACIGNLPKEGRLS